MLTYLLLTVEVKTKAKIHLTLVGRTWKKDLLAPKLITLGEILIIKIKIAILIALAEDVRTTLTPVNPNSLAPSMAALITSHTTA